MSDQTDNLINLVKPYGLSDEEGNIYVFLLQRESATALTLSRSLHLGRTKVYRLLDKLKTKQLIEVRFDERGMSFAATHPAKFQQLVTSKESEIAALKASLPSLINQLTKLTQLAQDNSKVLYYEGWDGLKQVSYNLTRAVGVVRVFEMVHLSEFLPETFSEQIRQECVDAEISFRDLTNQTSQTDFTQVTDLIKHFSKVRYIDPLLIKINFEVLIYNDVYTTYTYKDKKVFCVEIYNPQLAEMQKQVFDFIWAQASPLEYTGLHGAAKLPTRV